MRFRTLTKTIIYYRNCLLTTSLPRQWLKKRTSFNSIYQNTSVDIQVEKQNCCTIFKVQRKMWYPICDAFKKIDMWSGTIHIRQTLFKRIQLICEIETKSVNPAIIFHNRTKVRMHFCFLRFRTQLNKKLVRSENMKYICMSNCLTYKNIERRSFRLNECQ